MAIVFYGILWLAGGNDLVATTFDLGINAISWTLRVLLIVAPARVHHHQATYSACKTRPGQAASRL